MLLRLLMFFLAAGVLGGSVALVWGRVRRLRALRAPEMPEGWLRLASEDERLREALDLYERIAALVGRPDNGLGPELAGEVHPLLAGIAELAALRHELLTHLRGLDDARLDRDAALLPAERVAAQRAQLEALRARPAVIAAAQAEAVGDLRQVYLDLLAGVSGEGEGADAGVLGGAMARTRDRVTALRAQVQAEGEIRAALRERA